MGHLRDMGGKAFLIEDDRFWKLATKDGYLGAILQFDECANRVVTGSQGDSFLQRLLQWRAAEGFRRQRCRRLFHVLPKWIEGLFAKAKLRRDLIDGRAQLTFALRRPERLPALEVLLLR